MAGRRGGGGAEGRGTGGREGNSSLPRKAGSGEAAGRRGRVSVGWFTAAAGPGRDAGEEQLVDEGADPNCNWSTRERRRKGDCNSSWSTMGGTATAAGRRWYGLQQQLVDEREEAERGLQQQLVDDGVDYNRSWTTKEWTAPAPGRRGRDCEQTIGLQGRRCDSERQ